VIGDASSDGTHIILGMLIVGFIFLGVIGMGEAVRAIGYRRRARRMRSL
jgi:hypothetical protein